MITKQSVNKSGRIIIGFIAFFWVIFILRAFQVQILDSKKFKDYANSQQQSTIPLAARRGTVYDCNGNQLAYDIEAKSYTVNPRYMKRPSDAAAKLAEIIGQPKAYWMSQFQKRPGFLIVARRVSQEIAYQLDNSDIETLHARSETQRIYPYGLLASEVIGRVDADNKGISGLEKYYDSTLSGVDGQSIYLRDAYGREVTSWEQTLAPPRNGSDICLALDLNLQEIVESELQEKLDSCQAKWCTAVFLDVETGGILACATLENDKSLFRRCRAIADMNEPGSTAKIIPLSTVFENNICEPDDIINVEGGRCMIGGHLIRDDHAHGLLRCTEIGVYSSNIGAAKLGLKAGANLIYKSLVEFGFGAKTGIDFPGETPGTLYKPDSWTTHQLAITCFGYGMSASALQLADAYGVIASGGELRKPFFATKMVTADSIEKVLNSKTVVRKVLNERTVGIMDGIFREVVQTGTAKKAIDDMCWIAGKTGTALRAKQDGRGYETGKALASFIGYFPADDPKVVGIIMYDSPHGSIYGGDISAPVFKRIAKRYGTLPGNNILINSRPKSQKNKDDKLVETDTEAKLINVTQKRLIKEPQAKKKQINPGGFPDFTGQTMRDALRQAKNLGLECTITGSGIVVEQNPAPGLDTTGVQLVELIGETK
jgi:cell division protein FtsI (penicillin-binding protein 3)